jgi:hypothetical protein
MLQEEFSGHKICMLRVVNLCMQATVAVHVESLYVRLTSRAASQIQQPSRHLASAFGLPAHAKSDSLQR